MVWRKHPRCAAHVTRAVPLARAAPRSRPCGGLPRLRAAAEYARGSHTPPAALPPSPPAPSCAASPAARRRVPRARASATRRQRTDQAQRAARQAHGGAQFHQRLVEGARSRARPASSSPSARKRARVRGAAISAASFFTRATTRSTLPSTTAAAGRRRCWQSPRRCNRRCRAVPAWPHSRGKARRGDLPRGPQQVAGPRIVSQAAPQREHFLFRRRRQRLHRGKALQEPPVIRNHRLRAGLLQHDLRDPDAIRIAGRRQGRSRRAPVPASELHVRARRSFEDAQPFGDHGEILRVHVPGLEFGIQRLQADALEIPFVFETLAGALLLVYLFTV